MDGVKVALGNRGMTVKAARQCTKERKKWRALVHGSVPGSRGPGRGIPCHFVRYFYHGISFQSREIIFHCLCIIFN